jgi:alkylmercury lyase
MTTGRPDMGELADAITAAAPDLDPAGQRLFIAVYRLLAAGHPVTTAALAPAAGFPEAAAADALGRWPGVFTDRRGRVTGFWGLAIGELSPAHRFETGGRVLYAWCAWDTLFLPARLGQYARVTSACPATGELIELTVGPDGITGTSHPGAVVSFLLPDGKFDSGVVQSPASDAHHPRQPQTRGRNRHRRRAQPPARDRRLGIFGQPLRQTRTSARPAG